MIQIQCSHHLKFFMIRSFLQPRAVLTTVVQTQVSSDVASRKIAMSRLSKQSIRPNITHEEAYIHTYAACIDNIHEE
jgi:hypothetical protein